MYSLVSAPVLGFDLTRLPGGAATAEVLLRGLCLTAGDLPVLAERLPDEDVRQPLWLAVEDAGRALPTLRGLADEPDPAQAIGLVQRAPIGNLDGLLRCVRHDVMSWTWQASGGGNPPTPAPHPGPPGVCAAAGSPHTPDHLAPPGRPWLPA